MSDDRTFDVHVISHTHWDREWYLAAGRFRQRLVDLIDDLLDAPATPFLLDGQAAILDDYLAVRPDRRAQLGDRLRGGSLEAGPWYVLADELIPSAEALVRNLLAGRRALAALGAEAPPVLYSPDSFGHPAALPTLAAGFGYHVAVVWRGLGGDRWPPGDSFRWRAADGSEVLVHHLPPAGYEYGANLPADEAELRARWTRLRAELASRARLKLLLLLNGADHHAPQHDLEEALAALERVACHDRILRSSLRAFAVEVVRQAGGVDLPEIAGELRDSSGHAWSLQGTFATRAGLKRRNAHAERLLTREAEPWVAVATRRGAPSRRYHVEACWRALLLCHPHDTLCGCAADEVARAMAARLDDVDAQARGARDDALSSLIGHDPVRARVCPERWRSVVVVRNAAARPRRGVAEVEIPVLREHVPVGPPADPALAGHGQPSTVSPSHLSLDGGRVPLQVLDRSVRHDRIESPEHYPYDDLVEAVRAVIWVDRVGAYGTLSLAVDAAAAASDPPHSVRAGDGWMDNGLLRVEMGSSGAVRLSAPGSGRAVRSFLRFEDVGDAGDLYTHSPIDPVVDKARFLGARLTQAGPLRAELRAAWELAIPDETTREARAAESLPHVLTATLILDAGSELLRVNIEGENAARDHRLRALFGTDVFGGDVHADAMFGPVSRSRRPSAAPSRAELQPATAPLHRYVSLANPERGVTVYSDGLAEYEALDSGEIAVTLLRAVGELSRNDLPERPGHAGWPVPTPEAQSLGAFGASFAVLLHGPRTADVVDAIERHADDALLPLVGSTLRSALQLPEPVDGAELEGTGLAFSALKESADGEWLVARCVNLLDLPVDGRWRFGFPVREARASRLDETVGDAITVADQRVVLVAAEPRAVVTILVR